MDEASGHSLPRYPLLKLIAGIGCRFGHAPSMVLLGAIHESSGGDEAIERANRLYRRAADKGDAQAMWSLGVNHLSSKGGVTDHAEAVRWLQKAVDHDHELAAWALGKMYLVGNSVARDESRGVELLRRGGELGNSAACRELAEIYEHGRFGVAADPEAARRWARRAEASPQPSLDRDGGR